MSSLDALSRIVTHHQIVIDTRFRTQSLDEKDKKRCVCPIPTMEKLYPLMIKQKGIQHSYQNGEIILILQDVKAYTTRTDKKATHLALLINAINKNGSVTVIKNPKTKARQEISPKHLEGEGYEVSSHMIIKIDGKSRTHDMVYMPIPKVSTQRINSFLDRILFLVSRENEDDFTCNTTTNIISPTTQKPIKIFYKPVFNITGKLDQELFNKINKEGLSDVVLIKNEFKSINAPDVNQAIIPKESTLRLVPNHGSQDVIGWIKNVSSFFNNDTNGGYDTIKIKFKEPDTGAVRQVDMQTDNIRLDGLEKTFIKKSVLDGFSSRLMDSYDIMNAETITKLIKAL